MNAEQIQKKTVRASKWSALTELVVKLIQPISNLILVRILAPEAFAAVALINMVVSFADIFTDAGFQKYVVQRDYDSEDQKDLTVNVAFWTNLGISVFLWAIIAAFQTPIAAFVKAPDLALGIVVAALALPMTSFSSIQAALFRRDFNFKTLFYTRLFFALVPLAVTIPLALLGLNYWAIVIGTLCGRLFEAVFLTAMSKWKPSLRYSARTLAEMFSYSSWTLVESISTWLTIWIGTFIVSQRLTEHYTGIYATVINTVNGIMAIVVSATQGVLFASLSRLKNDREEYMRMFHAFQRLTAMFVLPMGVGMFVFREPITEILLGEKWMEGAPLLGSWGLAYAFSIIFGNLISSIYQSLGVPKLSVLAQWLHIIVLAPVCYYFAAFDFSALAYARSASRFEFILAHFLIVYFALKISPWKMVKNIFPYLAAASAMGVAGAALQRCAPNVWASLAFIAVCAFLYAGCLLAVKTTRTELLQFIRKALTRG